MRTQRAELTSLPLGAPGPSSPQFGHLGGAKHWNIYHHGAAGTPGYTLDRSSPGLIVFRSFSPLPFPLPPRHHARQHRLHHHRLLRGGAQPPPGVPPRLSFESFKLRPHRLLPLLSLTPPPSFSLPPGPGAPLLGAAGPHPGQPGVGHPTVSLARLSNSRFRPILRPSMFSHPLHPSPFHTETVPTPSTWPCALTPPPACAKCSSYPMKAALQAKSSCRLPPQAPIHRIPPLSSAWASFLSTQTSGQVLALGSSKA